MEEDKDAFIKKLNHALQNIDGEIKRLNAIFSEKEDLEIEHLRNSKYDSSLYPSILNPNFSAIIANKKEFYETKYDEDIKDIEEEAEKLCNAEFELAPHQMFVRNFMSKETPYNSLLLFHGLGTGKTCSAISIAEDTRKHTQYKNKILIIASPNVQDNFRKQLFNPDSLVEDNGVWTMRKSCVGNRILQEVNPLQRSNIKKSEIIKQMKQFIDNHYEFISDKKLSNRVQRTMKKFSHLKDEKEKNKRIDNELRSYYSNRLVIIDEVHNIRDSSDSEKKKIAKHLIRIANVTLNMKLLLLSATPMFDNHREIIFLLNLMNVNDGRPYIEESQVFLSNGDFVTDERGRSIGEEIILKKSRGYISFIRGENVYSFPYRIFPTLFDPSSSILNENFVYPTQHIMGNNKHIVPMEHLDIYMIPMGHYQEVCYKYIVNSKLREMIPDENNMQRGIGWKLFRQPVQSLNMTYPNKKMIQFITTALGDSFLKADPMHNPMDREEVDKKLNSISFSNENIVKENVLSDINSAMNNTYFKNFSYKKTIEKEYGRIFSLSELWKYSHKIYQIMKKIKESKGIVLIYSQYIEGGCIPIALALEELGLRRYKGSSLFKKAPSPPIDAISMKSKELHDKEETTPFHSAKYIMITGNKNLSEYNKEEVQAASNMPSNAYGKDVKVIIISKAGSEGIDFKCIRQVHILDPWYNNNRNEQIIGRAIRFCSHASLPFKERNAEIYLYGTLCAKKEEECIDLFIYRMAELKSLKIGYVARLLKSNAVDCLLTKGITNMSEERFNQSIDIHLSSGKTISYKVGDKPYSEICDYMDTCSYACKPVDVVPEGTDKATYSKTFILLNVDRIIQHIRNLFYEKHSFKKSQIVKQVKKHKDYPMEQIENALETLVQDDTEFVRDKYDRLGRVIHNKDVYMFQPIEVLQHRITHYERSKPIDYKHKKIQIQLEKKEEKKMITEKVKIDELLERLFIQFSKSKRTDPITRGNTDWYKHIGHAIERIHMRDNISLQHYVAHHMFDTLLLTEKRELLEFLLNDKDNGKKYKKVNETGYDCIPLLKAYVNKHCFLKKDSDEIYVLSDGKELVYYVVEERSNKKLYLKAAPPLTKEAISEHIKTQINEKEAYHKDIMGFMSMFKSKDKPNVFKMKTFKRKNMSGAMCEQATKQSVIKYIHSVVDIPYNPKVVSKITNIGLCGELELLLRHYQAEKRDNKIWFLNTEHAILQSISTL